MDQLTLYLSREQHDQLRTISAEYNLSRNYIISTILSVFLAEAAADESIVRDVLYNTLEH